MTQDTGRDADLVAMNATAAAHVAESVPYTFSEDERRILRPFFTNTERKVFFIHGLPTAVLSALLAMYSRLKNRRGLRGHFVENLVPQLVGTQSDDFVARAGDPTLWRQLADAERIKVFLARWLDAYGHNSIARTAHVVLCVEECSVLTAKSLEWSRPGAGYIELSTRYVDFSGKSLYPAWEEVGVVAPQLADQLRENADMGLRLYRELMGENVDGPFPSFLREEYGHIVTDPKKLEAAVLGESCDVLGNLLPCATLTSVGVAVSGETFPQILKHLVLDGTAENIALAHAIESEADRAGVAHFIRHWQPSEWDRVGWIGLRQIGGARSLLVHNEAATRSILTALDRWPGIFPISATTLFEGLLPSERGDFDKLPRAFETVSAMFEGHMSFRGWRDLHRMGFCTHQRAIVTPEIGFYAYPKPAPAQLAAAFDAIHSANGTLLEASHASPVPSLMLQYGMAMGNLVRYQLAANLRQMEFCNWQRSKWAVNDEVRGEFLSFERALRKEYPWWGRISRADMTPHYAFARGEKMVL